MVEIVVHCGHWARESKEAGAAWMDLAKTNNGKLWAFSGTSVQAQYGEARISEWTSRRSETEQEKGSFGARSSAKKKTKAKGAVGVYLEGLGGAGEVLGGAELGAHQALGVLHAHLVEKVVAAGGPGGGGLEGRFVRK